MIDIEQRLRDYYAGEPDDLAAERRLRQARAGRARPPLRRWLAAVAAAVVVVAVVVAISLTRPAGPRPVAAPDQAAPASPALTTSVPTSVTPRPVPKGWASWTQRTGGGRLTVYYPRSWNAVPWDGLPAPTVFPLIYLSPQRIWQPCPTATHCSQTDPRLSRDGVLVSWRLVETPEPSPLADEPGRPTTIDQRPARLYAGRPLDGCTQYDAAAQISAAIKASPDPKGYELFTMSACIGPDAPAADRAAVYTMLATVRIATD